ncbi:hypothetical protein QE152_g34847 [Popillia japonica]|uniref:Uncharacterized protein n=1 Tax=Popillia japonica TaxID=7064 RepID=A0AAW1ISJ1_POPJA
MSVVNIAETDEIVNDSLHFAQDIHFEGIEVNGFQKILNHDEEDVTPDDLLQNFTAVADGASEHTETLQKLPI